VLLSDPTSSGISFDFSGRECGLNSMMTDQKMFVRILFCPLYSRKGWVEGLLRAKMIDNTKVTNESTFIEGKRTLFTL
jgi:hypothetical protein